MHRFVPETLAKELQLDMPQYDFGVSQVRASTVLMSSYALDNDANFFINQIVRIDQISETCATKDTGGDHGNSDVRQLFAVLTYSFTRS